MKMVTVLVILLGIVAGVMLSSVSAAPTIGNVNVTNNPIWQNEPMVAINPLDQNKLVVGYNDYRSGAWKVGWSWSDNGGTNWTFGGTFSLTGYSNAADPVVAFDNAGTCYVAGLAYNPEATSGFGQDGSVFLAKSNDGGHTFSVFRKIVAAGSGTANHLDKPWLYVNPANNHIYLAWVKRVNAWGVGGTESMTIWFTRSTDGGVNFSTPIQVSTFSPATGIDRSHGPQITAASATAVFVSWHTLEAGNLPSPPTTPWKIWVAESTDGGVNFGTNHLAVTTVWGYPNRFLSMDADPASGKVYIGYADSHVMTPRDYDIFVTSSTSAAGPWTTPMRINDDPVGNGRWQYWPALDVAPNGRVDIIWYDQRDDPNRVGVYYGSSIDEGATWATNLKVTDLATGFTPTGPSDFAGDYSTVASTDEKAVAVWMDNRLGNQEIYEATIIQKPVDAILVLDMSGSMLSAACPTCDPKLQVLKEAVEIFVVLWDGLAVASPQHRLGVTYFRTNVDEFMSGGQALLPLGPTNTNAADIISNVNGQSTVSTNLTAMGGGLQSAINRLTSTRPRSIILFTDGMQNVNPMVMQVGGSHEINNDPNITPSSNINPTPTPTVLNLQLQRRINTIGVGATPAFVTLLQQIATGTDGVSYTTIAPDNNLRRFFVEQLVDALRDASPQLIDYRYGRFIGAIATETFTLNRTVRRIIFKVSWKSGGPPIEIEKVEKAGVDLTGFGEITEGAFYRIYSLDLLDSIVSDQIQPEGDWSLQLRGVKGTPFEVAAITDEEKLAYTFDVSEASSKVGDPLQLTARFSVDGRPLTDVRKVTAQVLKPGVGIGTALSTTRTPVSLPTTTATYQVEPAATAGQKKLEMLLQDQNFYTKLQSSRTTVQLANQGDGSYTSTFTDTDIPGGYSVIFRATGEHPVIGPYTRTETRSADVEFAAADFAATGLLVASREPGADVTKVTLQLRPRDVHGNYLGPDYGHRIEISTSPGSVTPGFKDLLDGRYQFDLNVPTGVDPAIRVAVMEKTLYEGPLSAVRTTVTGYRFALSAHAGGTVPLSNFDNLVDPGLLAELDFEYRFAAWYSVVGVLGSYNFDPDYQILGGTVYLRRYRPLRSGMDIYAEAGAGIYDPEGLDLAFGLSLGAGVSRGLTPRLRGELGANYFHLFSEGDDIDFVGVKVGLRLTFP